MISIQVQIPEMCSFCKYHISQGKQSTAGKVQLVTEKNHRKSCPLYCYRYYLNLNEILQKKKWFDMTALKVASVCLCKYSSFSLLTSLPSMYVQLCIPSPSFPLNTLERTCLYNNKYVNALQVVLLNTFSVNKEMATIHS